jgi:hypothetical protein
MDLNERINESIWTATDEFQCRVRFSVRASRKQPKALVPGRAEFESKWRIDGTSCSLNNRDEHLEKFSGIQVWSHRHFSRICPSKVEIRWALTLNNRVHWLGFFGCNKGESGPGLKTWKSEVCVRIIDRMINILSKVHLRYLTVCVWQRWRRLALARGPTAALLRKSLLDVDTAKGRDIREW